MCPVLSHVLEQKEKFEILIFWTKVFSSTDSPTPRNLLPQKQSLSALNCERQFGCLSKFEYD